jgi:hypothetical protein
MLLRYMLWGLHLHLLLRDRLDEVHEIVIDGGVLLRRNLLGEAAPG